MKTLSCDICDQPFSANTFGEWMEKMKPHYMANHADVIAQNAGKSKEDGIRWMADMKAKFEAA